MLQKTLATQKAPRTPRSSPLQKGKMCIVEEVRRYSPISGEKKLYLVFVTGKTSLQKLALLYHSPSGTKIARSHRITCDLSDLFSRRFVRTYGWKEIDRFLKDCKENWFRRDGNKNYKTFDQWLTKIRRVLEAIGAPEHILQTVAALSSN